MAYEKQVWADGEVITGDRLNHMEQGIADAASSLDISATATVDAGGGEPSVSVERGETESGLSLAFAFKGIKGEAGDAGAAGAAGAAAGFGVPAAAVQSLGAGEAPTASVSASGGSADQVFAFAFGIPKGDAGANGSAGVSAPTISSLELLVSGSVVSGKLMLSDGGEVAVAGTYTAGDASAVVGEAVVNEAVVGAS